MVLVLALTVLLLLVIYLLFIPILLVINTETESYYLQAKGLFHAKVVSDDVELVILKLKLLGWSFEYYPLQKWLKRSNDKTEVIQGGKSRSTKNRFNLKWFVRFLNSFQIKKLYLNIDSGNCITNAKLYPVFALLNFYVGGFNLNFMGRNTVILEVENKPIRLIKTFINA